MREFTKEVREEIIRAHVAKFGRYQADEFIREVRSSNGTHPAWSWFEWNDGNAAEEHRLWQARMFVQGLRISFEVQDVRARKRSKVVVVTAPAYISPVEDRKDGGGYVATDPHNPAHQRELAGQGARALLTWLERYRGILTLLGIDPTPLDLVAERMAPTEAQDDAA